MPERGYAVINIKTTGLFPYLRDRVIEVAVVHLDQGGSVTAHWESIINPGSHIADADNHGVSTAELLRAPTFAQIVPSLIDLLRGRVLVAHNAQLVTGFLMHEFELIGYARGRGLEVVCTMQLARSYLPGAGRLLIDCCAAYDIEVARGPGALVQAMACGSLLAAYLSGSSSMDPWISALDRAAGYDWPKISGVAATEWVERDPVVVDADAPTSSFLERAALRLPDYTGPEEHLDYLALLDLCVLNPPLSPRETRELRVAAQISGISGVDCATLHHSYFEDLVRGAWANGALSVADSADLIAVARMLEVAPEIVAAALVAPSSPICRAKNSIDTVLLEQGDIVVLTGEMARARSDWGRELVARGLSLGTAVTLRTRLLVAADPQSETGKTGKARDYGIPIVSEFGLRSLIGVR